MKSTALSVFRHIIGGVCLLFSLTSTQAAVQVFNLVNASFKDGTARASGTVSIDTTLGTFSGVQISIVDTSPTYGNGTASFSSIAGQAPFDNGTDYYFFSNSAAGDVLVLEVPRPNLVGYPGGSICFDGSTCGSISYVQFAGKTLNTFTGGTLTPVPNPPGAWLLLAGLCVLALVNEPGLRARRNFNLA